MSTPLQILLEMGFPQSRAEKALIVTGGQGAEAAMEWLLVHSEDPHVDDPLEDNCKDSVTVVNQHTPEVLEDCSSNVEAAPGGSDDAKQLSCDENESISDSLSQPKSIQCDVCQKLFKSEAEVEFHAAKSGHDSFSESTEEVRQLTEEEKAEQLKQLQDKLRSRRMQKEEDEKQEAIKKEKMRRRMGQEMLESKKRVEEEEIKRLAQQRRQEKMEEKMARQRILEQIERDKQARKEKFGPAVGSHVVTVPLVASSTESSTAAPSSKKEYTETRLQIRLTNGQTLIQSFGSKEELAAVRLYIEMNRTDGSGPFNMMTNFPKKVFSEEDMEKPLYQLGLVPSAVLILGKGAVA